MRQALVLTPHSRILVLYHKMGVASLFSSNSLYPVPTFFVCCIYNIVGEWVSTRMKASLV